MEQIKRPRNEIVVDDYDDETKRQKRSSKKKTLHFVFSMIKSFVFLVTTNEGYW
jgi:hypothetical protein